MALKKQDFIKQLNHLVQTEPNVYDANKLQGAIDIVNKSKDLDALWLTGAAQLYLVKDNHYDWIPLELDKVKDCITKCGLNITQVKQLEKEPGRDDYAFVTDNEDYKVIWVCKMQPLWQNEGVYKLLGVGMSFPSKDYQSLNLLVKDLEYRLK